MFKIHKKKSVKSVFLPDDVPELKPNIFSSGTNYKVQYRKWNNGDITAEYWIFNNDKNRYTQIQHYKYTGEYWKFLNTTNL